MSWPLLPARRPTSNLHRPTPARARRCAKPRNGTTPLRERLAAALCAPLVYGSADAIRHERRHQHEALQALSSELRHAPPPGRTLDDLAWAHFTLAYMGADDTDLMRELGALMQQAAQAVAPQLVEAPACARPQRVVLVGSVFRDCTAGAYFGGWIGWLRAFR